MAYIRLESPFMILLVNTKFGRGDRWLHRGFTLIEALIGMAVIGIVFLSLYGGLTSGFSATQVARENLRATQILAEKMETMRLYTFDQISSNGFIPASFTAPYYPLGQAGNQGITYTGTVSIAAGPNDVSYRDNLKQITVTATWSSGNVQRSRQMTTYVARDGLQSYVY